MGSSVQRWAFEGVREETFAKVSSGGSKYYSLSEYERREHRKRLPGHQNEKTKAVTKNQNHVPTPPPEDAGGKTAKRLFPAHQKRQSVRKAASVSDRMTCAPLENRSHYPLSGARFFLWSTNPGRRSLTLPLPWAIKHCPYRGAISP